MYFNIILLSGSVRALVDWRSSGDGGPRCSERFGRVAHVGSADGVGTGAAITRRLRESAALVDSGRCGHRTWEKPFFITRASLGGGGSHGGTTTAAAAATHDTPINITNGAADDVSPSTRYYNNNMSSGRPARVRKASE